MQSNIAGASLGPKRRFGGMTKLLNPPRPFVLPTRSKASMPMTTTSTAMTMANSNTTTHMANVTSMMLSYSSSMTIAARMANDAMMENVNTNSSTTKNTNASTMASMKSMMTNRTRLLMANDTTVSTLAGATATKQRSTATTATKRNSAATTATKRMFATDELKRKYDDSEDDSDDDSEDDSDEDHDDPPPPKKRIHSRLPEDSTYRIKKRIQTELLQNMSQFKDVLLRTGGFVEMHWRLLYDQLGDDNEYVRELFFSEHNKRWRKEVLGAARDIVAPNRLGRVSFMAAIVIGEMAPFTRTLLFIVGDDKANDVTTGNLVSTLEEYRNGNDSFVPPPDVAPCFAKGDWDKACEFALLEYNSILAHTAGCYAYESAMELATEVKNKYELSTTFPTFADGSYKERVSFPSAEVIKEMYELPREDLDARIKKFLNENTELVEGSDDYENALRMRTVSVLRCGSIMNGSAQLLYDGYAGLAPLADGSYAVVTMGRPEMVEEGRMTRIICPGMSNRHYGGRDNNEHSIPFDPYLLVSTTRSLVFNTNAHGQFSNLDDDTYGARTIKVGGNYRLFRRLHENQKCSELVRYDLHLPGHGTIQHHQFNLIYAKACGIGTESFEYIYAKVRTKSASSNMAEKHVNPEDRCDGDHCFHRLMMISNSIYFCFPVDHSTNQCCSYHRMNASDWNYTLTVRKYVNGN